MKLERLVPVAGALLLVFSMAGAPALATGHSNDYESWCEEQYDTEERQEDCKDAYEQRTYDSSGDESDSSSGDGNATDESSTSGDDGSDDGPDCSRWDGAQREKCEAYRQRHGGDASPDWGPDWNASAPIADRPEVIEEIPASIAPDVEERREFFREQAREHREFHLEQVQERRELAENQSAERREFLADLADEYLNETTWDGEDARNHSAEEVRERLRLRSETPEDAVRDLRAFLMKQQEERQALLDDQRQEHQAFHEKLHDELRDFVREERKEAEKRARQRHQEWQERQAEMDRDAPAPMGAFQASDGSVDGNFVSFNYTADPAALADVSVTGVPVFDLAALDGTARKQFRGASFALLSEDGALTIHDNPAVAFMINPRDGVSWTLDMAGHLTVNATEDDERWRVTDGETLHGVLLFEDDPAYDEMNNTFRGDDGVRFVRLPDRPEERGGGDGAPGTADADDGREVSEAKRAALARGTLGAEVTLAKAENGSIEDETVVYDDLEVRLEETDAGHVSFVVDGELETGRTIVLNAPPALFEGDGLAVSYHDVYENGSREEVPIRLADGVRDVMSPNDDSTPEYLPAKGADGWEIMVSVPHFSAHAVTVQSVTNSAPPSVVAGVLSAVGFLVLAGGNLFRRRG